MYQPQYLNHPTDAAEMAAREVAIEKAYDAYGHLLFNYIRRFIINYHLAEDLFQTLWLTVLESISSRQIMQYGLLKRRLQQIITDCFRHKFLMGELRLLAPNLVVSGESLFLQPGDDAEEAHLKRIFWENFEGLQLTDNEKDAFWLKERYGYTTKEIAQHFGIPMMTTADRIAKVRRVCAEYLNENKYDGQTIKTLHRKRRCRTGAGHRQAASA